MSSLGPLVPRVPVSSRWVSTSQLAIQKSILSAAARKDGETILQILVDQPATLGPINVATAAHRLAKLRLPQSLRERSKQQLQAPILAAAPEFGAQAVANTIWALAKLGYQEDLLWSSLSSRATLQLAEFTGRHLANVAWSMASMARDEGPLLQRLSYEIMLKAEAAELSPQSLANVLWSFAFLAMWESKMMLAPLEAVQSYAETFNARDLSNTLWALSLYKGSRDFDSLDWKKLLSSLAVTATLKADQMHPNDLTSIAWAFVDATPLQLHWLQRQGVQQRQRPRANLLRYELLD